MSDFYKELIKKKRKWLVTGAAGFIGTNIVKKLLDCEQHVVAFDNFSTGLKENIKLQTEYSKTSAGTYKFIEGDLRDVSHCEEATKNVDVVLHNGALGSVPRSIEKPLDTHDSNVTGFINIINAAKENNVPRFVYASSSSVYGDEPTLPKVESKIGKPLSPYAASKYINEVYADVFSRNYKIETIGLRYFNVFGPHQQPDGPYAAVIPKWIGALLEEKRISIFGDGETSRDFCYVDNVVQVNLRAGIVENPSALNQAYNVAYFQRTTLNELFEIIREMLLVELPQLKIEKPTYEEFRAGDVRHSLADITKCKTLLGYEPQEDVLGGLKMSIAWYIQNHYKRGN